MLRDLLLIGIGTVGLYFGAEWLVRGASRLARAFGLSATVVGLTVVAFGTSMPEWVVGVFGGAQQASDLILGNVVGSNILNIALILGLTAIIFPIPVQMRVVRDELPIMIIVMVAITLFALDGTVSRADGAIFLVGLVWYLWRVFARAEDPESESEFEQFEAADEMGAGPVIGWKRNAALTVVGLAVLLGGAHLMVDAAVDMARRIGISEVVIGLTIVALGTSLPELATGLVAAFRKQPDIAVGNVVGSNVFNGLAVLGTAGLIHPARVEASILSVDMPLMILLSLLLLPITRRHLRIERWEGGLLVGGYLIFTWLLWVRL